MIETITIDTEQRAGVQKLYEAAKAAKKYLEPDLVEPGRTVFWNLVDAIRDYEKAAAPRPVPTLTYSDLARIAIECGLQSSDEHWGTVYRAVSLSQLMAFAEALRPAEPDGGAV